MALGTSARPPAPGDARTSLHPAWWVAATAFVALIGAAGFRAAPGVLLVPLEEEFGWSRGVLSLAVSVNLVLFGLTAPFAAALIDRFGIRRVTSYALLLIAVGSAGAVVATQSWHLVLTWGVLVGLGTGSMALVFAATVAGRWFDRHQGLVLGVLTAASATGQLIFLPVLALLSDAFGWRVAALTVAGAALVVVPLVAARLRDFPADVGLPPYGAPEGTRPHRPAPPTVNPAVAALGALRDAARTKAFWALAGGFAICGASTNGLVGTHFVPAAHDHGMATTAAAGLLAVVGVFDVVGTIASGWLTDRVDPRLLLGGYYAFRGVSLALLPLLLSDSVRPSIVVFVVVYGLDWVATVPPTVALCREVYGDRGTLVFGWVFASHQVGAAVATTAAGFVRDVSGTYTLAWLAAAGLCAVAAVVSLRVSGPARPRPASATVEPMV